MAGHVEGQREHCASWLYVLVKFSHFKIKKTLHMLMTMDMDMGLRQPQRDELVCVCRWTQEHCVLNMDKLCRREVEATTNILFLF